MKKKKTKNKDYPFPKVFSNEKTFKKFLYDNRDYVLNLMSEGKKMEEKKFICDSTFMLCTVRYALGRKTYIVDRVVEWVLGEWESIDDIDKEKIVNEIISFEKNYGNLGSMWEREKWYHIINREISRYFNEII